MKSALLTCALALVLAGCGGGGSDDGGLGSMTDQVVPPTTGMMPVETPAPTVQDVQTSDPSGGVNAASQAASALPAFGSVTQSATQDGVTGISTDRASTSFDADSFTLTINRQGDTPLVLSTVDDEHIVYPAEVSPLNGHDTLQGGFILDYSMRESTVAYAVVSWDSTDSTDYLSGGYWLHVSGDIAGSDAMIDGAGAFADGPEISSPASMPITGSASYAGEAQGLYAATYGADEPSRQGDSEIGLFNGDLALTADFSARTISGCVGCNGGAYVDGYASDYLIRLGATPFESNGEFRGTSVALESPSANIASTSGAWGGKFSNVANTAGDPRLVAGTLGGEATTAGGSEVVFVGAYYALGQ